MESHARIFVFVTWLVLLMLVIMHQITPVCSFPALTVALFYSLPLLIPLPGLLRGNYRTYTWATLCLLPYFIVGITEAVANPAAHAWALALLGTSLSAFFALIGLLRITQRNISNTF